LVRVFWYACRMVRVCVRPWWIPVAVWAHPTQMYLGEMIALAYMAAVVAITCRLADDDPFW